MEKIKLLLVEDNEEFMFILKNTLELMGNYDIRTAGDGREGLDVYKSFDPDVIVADIEMPIMDGKEMVRIIREKDPYTLVFFVTSHKETKDVLDGMEAGADIYLRKPLSAQELDAQIRVLLKRTSNKQLPVMGNEECAIGAFSFSASNGYLSKQGKRKDLTKTEAKILNMLALEKGRLVKKDDILTFLSSDSYTMDTRTLDVHILNIRRKLSADPSVKIKTVRQKGYILEDGFG